MGRRALTAAVLAAAAACAPAQAASLAGPLDGVTGWGGANPFRCTLQPAGFEATGPDPAADPYCVEFDKTRQNVTGAGIVEFAALEPARVGAAAGKCFYFQHDHWRAAVVQDDGATEIWEWDGSYFFDKATGNGGAYVTNFAVNGRTSDPAAFPGIPQEYARYMGPGTGGVRTLNAFGADPRCAARAAAEHDAIYAPPPD